MKTFGLSAVLFGLVSYCGAENAYLRLLFITWNKTIIIKKKIKGFLHLKLDYI